MDDIELAEFCKEWLENWTGNMPEKLIEFYTEDALYIDPANREGLRGHKEILPYFEKILAANPNWTWKPLEIIPTEKGCILKWECTIPVGERIINEKGLDIVELKERRICRNEVYFDQTRLVAAIKKQKRV